MRSLILLLVISAYVGFAHAQESGLIRHEENLPIDSIEPAAKSNAAQVQEISGQFGLIFSIGLLTTLNDLVIDDPSDTHQSIGFPMGGGLYYFVSERVAGTIEFAYIPLPDINLLGGITESWSTIEYGATVRYLLSPTLSKSIYLKIGLKMARLKGTRRPGEGFFGGSVGTYSDMETAYLPGGELGVGATGIRSRGTALFVEFTYSHIFLKGADVKVRYEEAAFGYPLDLKLFALRLGLRIAI